VKIKAAVLLLVLTVPTADENRAAERQRDRRIVAACLKGDEDAWAELWKRYGPVVKTVARRVGCDAEEAKDVLQLVGMAALQGLDRLRDPEKLGGWLAGTARYQALAVIRRRGRTAELHTSHPSNDTAPEDALQRDQELFILRRAMVDLDQRCRRLIRTLDLTEPPDSYQQVAKAEGLAPSSIGPIRRRCLRRLKKIIERLSRKPLAAHLKGRE